MTNAEKFKSAKERTEAFDVFCDNDGCVKCPCYNDRSDRILCTFSWLDLKYKEKLKSCPFCGGTPVMADNTETMKSLSYFVRCTCGARTVSALSTRAAAAIWNRRVK